MLFMKQEKNINLKCYLLWWCNVKINYAQGVAYALAFYPNAFKLRIVVI